MADILKRHKRHIVGKKCLIVPYNMREIDRIPHIGSINGRDGWIFFGFPKCRCILTKVSEVKEDVSKYTVSTHYTGYPLQNSVI